MKVQRLFILFLYVFLLTNAVGWSETVVEGTVTLPKSHFLPVVNKRYEVVVKNGVTAIDPPRAVVYLEGSFGKPANLAVMQMAQKDLAFVTPLLAVQTGTKVEFPNLDDTYHNIYSYSPAKRFDLGRYRSDERPIPSQVFDVPGLVMLHCDIHEHMRGLIVVLETPHFVVTDTNGHYRLSGLPAGHYTLKAWVDSKTTREQPVDLKNGTPLHVDFTP
jgi:plastocyanin